MGIFKKWLVLLLLFFIGFGFSTLVHDETPGLLGEIVSGMFWMCLGGVFFTLLVVSCQHCKSVNVWRKILGEVSTESTDDGDVEVTRWATHCFDCGKDSRVETIRRKKVDFPFHYSE